jgi:hypothetical protein
MIILNRIVLSHNNIFDPEIFTIISIENYLIRNKITIIDSIINENSRFLSLFQYYNRRKMWFT